MRAMDAGEGKWRDPRLRRAARRAHHETERRRRAAPCGSLSAGQFACSAGRVLTVGFSGLGYGPDGVFPGSAGTPERAWEAARADFNGAGSRIPSLPNPSGLQPGSRRARCLRGGAFGVKGGMGSSRAGALSDGNGLPEAAGHAASTLTLLLPISPHNARAFADLTRKTGLRAARPYAILPSAGSGGADVPEHPQTGLGRRPGR
jgi:hypothetical protein